MKISTIVVGGIVGVAAIQIVGAKIIGASVEDGLQQAVQAYSEQARIPVVVSDFDGGWFGSSFTLSVPIPAEFTEPLQKFGFSATSGEEGATFNITSNISHGPIIFDNGLHFGAAYASGIFSIDANSLMNAVIETEKDQEERAELEKLQPIIAQLANSLQSTYYVDISFNGDVKYYGDMAGGSVSISDLPAAGNLTAFTLDILPATGGWQLNGAGTMSTATSIWGGVTGSARMKNGQEVEFSMGAIDLSTDYSKFSKSLWIGDVNATVASMTAKGDVEGKPFDIALGTMEFSTNTGLIESASELMSSKATMAFNDIIVAANGGTLSFDQIVLDLDMQNLLVPLMEAEAKMAQDNWLNTIGASQNADPFAVFKDPGFEAVIDRQLGATPRVNISDYKITANGEEIRISGFLQLNPGATAETAQTGALGPLLDGEFTFRLSPEMAKSVGFQAAQMSPQKLSQEQINQVVDMQLGQYSQLGFIKPDGDNFVSNITIKADILAVNGKPVMQISKALGAAQAAQTQQHAPAVSE
jgi:Bacterial protein of unknown function (DUF945)